MLEEIIEDALKEIGKELDNQVIKEMIQMNEPLKNTILINELKKLKKDKLMNKVCQNEDLIVALRDKIHRQHRQIQELEGSLDGCQTLCEVQTKKLSYYKNETTDLLAAKINLSVTLDLGLQS